MLIAPPCLFSRKMHFLYQTHFRWIICWTVAELLLAFLLRYG